MSARKSGGLPVTEAAANKTHPRREVDPNLEFTGPGGQAEPVTAGDGHARWRQFPARVIGAGTRFRVISHWQGADRRERTALSSSGRWDR
jgi:hypothetical protein